MFQSYDAVVDATANAWNKLLADAGGIASHPKLDRSARSGLHQTRVQDERLCKFFVGLTNSLIECRFSVVVPVFETALRANVELDGNATQHLSLVGVLSEINLAIFLKDVRLLAENARLRFNLARHLVQHLRTYPNGAITLPQQRASTRAPAPRSGPKDIQRHPIGT